MNSILAFVIALPVGLIIAFLINVVGFHGYYAGYICGGLIMMIYWSLVITL